MPFEQRWQRFDEAARLLKDIFRQFVARGSRGKKVPRPAAKLEDPPTATKISALLARQMTAKLRRLPFITTLHGTDITLVGVDPSYFPITKYSIEESDGVIHVLNAPSPAATASIVIGRHIAARAVDHFAL